MAEYCCFSNKLQDTLIKNHPKKYPLVLKMAVLAAAMTCSACICSAFLKQIEEPNDHRIIRTDSTEDALFHVARANLTNKNCSDLSRVNLTAQNQSNFVIVNLTEKDLSLVNRANLTEASEITLPHPMGVNLTEKPSHLSELSESQLSPFDWNKTKTYSRDEIGCMTVSPYAIVSKQRSGSKWFETLLNSHENIRSHGEIFHNVDEKYNMTVIKTLLDKVYSLNWNINNTFKKKKRNCLAAVGFRWMLNQGVLDNQEGIVDYFNHREVSVILLLRRNHLRRLVSLKANNHDGRAKELNGTHKAHVKSKQEAEILASYKPKLDVKHLIPALEHMEKLAAYTLQNFEGTRHMVVYYEDLIQNQTQIMMEVLAFLKAPQRTLISKDVKIHTRPLEQQIENWRAVAKVIKRSKYRRFITANDYEI